MRTDDYKAPAVQVLTLDSESVLCVSGLESLKLPTVDWKDGVEW